MLLQNWRGKYTYIPANVWSAILTAQYLNFNRQRQFPQWLVCPGTPFIQPWIRRRSYIYLQIIIAFIPALSESHLCVLLGLSVYSTLLPYKSAKKPIEVKSTFVNMEGLSCRRYLKGPYTGPCMNCIHSYNYGRYICGGLKVPIAM